MNAYVPLWVKTHHSFLEGVSSPEELIDTAANMGLDTMAITDRDGMYGLARAHILGEQKKIRVICGAQVTVAHEKFVDVPRPPESTGDSRKSLSKSPSKKSRSRSRSRKPKKKESSSGYDPRDERVLLLAQTRAGYGKICRLLTVGQARCEKKSASRVTREELMDIASEGDLLALATSPSLLATLHDSFRGHLYALVTRHLHARERRDELAQHALTRTLNIPRVGAVEVLYHDRARRPLQDIVTCIRHGVTLTTAGTHLRRNREHDLKTDDAMRALFRDAPELLERTREVAERCTFGLEQLRYVYPAERLPDGQSAHGWLRKLTQEGARKRYPSGVTPEFQKQIEHELALIEELDFGGYFLTMHEIVSYCRAQNIFCQGRGSAANSAVCYALGITAVDPVRMDLLFERFLSRERKEPPDIDLDIEHERREEVIQHVYERYGRRHSAMVANTIRYRSRSAVRDVGKALGIPSTDIDAVARLLKHRGSQMNGELCKDAGLDQNSPATRHLVDLTLELLDAPRHLGIHPGGFLLGHEPVDQIVPVEPATMENRTVIQWDKYDVEDLGLFKVDLLGLGALTCVHRCFDLLRKHDGLDYEMATVPQEDRATYNMVSTGDTVGTFQIESRAQMSMLPRLRPQTFYDLVIQVAIVRPGPIQGDMVHPYLRRRDGKEKVELPHPKLERVLKRTLGVPIFQEQVMKLAVIVGGYTPGEADQLRRDMAAWKKSGRIEKHHDRMVPRMIENGIPEEFAERVFSQIRGFGEYGFPESHAASFALIAYLTSWLKCHHPAVFTCGMINSQPMGFYTAATLTEDAKRHGVESRPIDVTQIAWDCTLEPATRVLTKRVANRETRHAIRMGLRLVKGLGTREREAFESAARPFTSLSDFARKTQMNERALVALAESGAFACFGVNRRDALWSVRNLAKMNKHALALGAAETQTSFAALDPDHAILWDYRASAHSTRGHPMARWRKTLSARRMPRACDVNKLNDGRHIEYVGLVICRQRPGTASGVTFFTLEDETGFVNVVVWTRVFEKYATLAKTAVVMGVRGKIQYADNVTHLIAEHLFAPPEPMREGMPKNSRDFH